MVKPANVTIEKLQKRYPGLEFFDKGVGRFPWLRFQALRYFTEELDLPAIPKVRSSVYCSVITKELMGHGSTPEDLADSLARAA